MPTAEAILDVLTVAAHRAIGVAVAWHVLVLAALVALAAGWRPSARRAGQLLALPLLSVGAVASLTGNPFNAVVLAAGAGLLVRLARRGSPEPVRLAPPFFVGLGAAMVLVGWIYPHFLDDLYPVSYLFAAPIGVVPCATLYLVVGLALAGTLVDRAWAAVLAGLGLLYGVVGVVVLDVWLDSGLIAGSLALAARLLQRRPVSRLGLAAKA